MDKVRVVVVVVVVVRRGRERGGAGDCGIWFNLTLLLLGERPNYLFVCISVCIS